MSSKKQWTLYSSNEDAWQAMLDDCAKAEKRIVLEQFIFTADDFGKKMIDICAKRASSGVEVKFIWDAVGSFSFFGSNIAEDLRKKGIELIFWKTLIPGYFRITNYRSWFFRNHRRTLVIDGKVGYTGSMCVDDKLVNWRDTNVRLEGHVALEMENAFDRMWSRANKTRPLPSRTKIGDREFRYVTNYPAPGRRHILVEILSAIRKARASVYITTPYFVPTRRLAHALKQASRRGVDVRIILPEKSNFYAIDLGARSYFKSLLESGARIFLYQGNLIHSKTAIIDGEWATVGSLNMDSVSLLYNFEANIIAKNNDFAEELAIHFREDMQESKEITLNEWRNRFFLEKIPEILIRLVRDFL